SPNPWVHRLQRWLRRMPLAREPRALQTSHGAAIRHRPRHATTRSLEMGTLIGLLAWCLLLVLCWPLALLALVLWPIVWLLTLPFCSARITLAALFAFLQPLLFLPARLLGWRPAAAQARHAAGCAEPGASPRQRPSRSCAPASRAPRNSLSAS